MVERELSHPPSPVETLDGPELTAVDSGLHHHVVLAGPFLRSDDLVQILQIGGHWYCAGTVLPGIESRNRIVRMKGHGCENVHSIPAVFLEHLLVGGIASLNPMSRPYLVQPFGRRIHNSDLAHIRMGLVDRKEVFRSEEHTSELQSRGHLVCRLLLEKKKDK